MFWPRMQQYNMGLHLQIIAGLPRLYCKNIYTWKYISICLPVCEESEQSKQACSCCTLIHGENTQGVGLLFWIQLTALQADQTHKHPSKAVLGWRLMHLLTCSAAGDLPLSPQDSRVWIRNGLAPSFYTVQHVCRYVRQISSISPLLKYLRNVILCKMCFFLFDAIKKNDNVV